MRFSLQAALAIPLLGVFPCAAVAQSEHARVMVTVTSHDTGRPLAEAQATVEGTRISTLTDEHGVSTLTDVPPGVQFVQVRRSGFAEERIVLEIEPGDDVQIDVALLEASTGATAGPRVGVLGHLRDWESGDAVSNAVLRFPAVGAEALSDRRGRFSFDDVPVGAHVLEIRHITYGTRTEPVEITTAGAPSLEIRVPTEAIAIEGFEVTARSRLEEERRRRGTRLDVMTRADIERYERAAHHLGDLARHFPGLRSVEIHRGGIRTGVCIDAATRRAPTFDTQSCEPVLVMVDDIPLSSHDLLLHYPPHTLESIEYMGPVEAGSRYGTSASNGVLLVYTRGNGPYAERR